MFDVHQIRVPEGDILMRLRRHRPAIGRVQIASVPDRAEIDEGEPNCANGLSEIDHLGWSGRNGRGDKPRRETLEGLGWMRRLADTGTATRSSTL